MTSPTPTPTPTPGPDPDAPGDAASQLDPAATRARFMEAGLDEKDLAAGPIAQFEEWFAQAVASGMHEPNAMVLATADAQGRPSLRTVLLKRYDDRGFVFFTNYGSRKGRDIEATPHVSLLFPWHGISRQVVVAGTATRTGRDESVGYFRTRAHGSQLGAWASEQSSQLASRAELDRVYAELAERYPEGEDVPAPPQWGGYRVVPESVEFWQGRENRLHDRLRYVREGAGWAVERLCP